MKITILYFASLREQLGCAQEVLDVEANTVEELLPILCERGPQWQQALCDNAHLQVAVNHTVVDLATPLKEGDEVAFFPPVTGG
ncbi:MAG TPA: molybdopterin converting factor subunit 1 [Sulfurivirga caldicuralii]|nr:molybdopterin converting factor subunit 1 [Sulfurivirga caldicuralii]